MSEGLIKQAMKDINEKKNKINPDEESSEPSVLEKLLKIDEKIAIVMTLDMLLAGVDTVIFLEIKLNFKSIYLSKWVNNKL